MNPGPFAYDAKCLTATPRRVVQSVFGFAYMNNFKGKPGKFNQLPCGHAQTRRRRRREMVTRIRTARTRRCTENSQIPGKRKPNGTGRGFLQGHTRGAITPAPFVQTTSGCRATVPRTPRPGRPPPLVHDQPLFVEYVSGRHSWLLRKYPKIELVKMGHRPGTSVQLHSNR